VGEAQRDHRGGAARGWRPGQRAEAGWPSVKQGTDDRYLSLLRAQASRGEIGSGVNDARVQWTLLGLTRRQAVERLLEEH
jgi:hypothetical protein